jgi:hypothetical protein
VSWATVFDWAAVVGVIFMAIGVVVIAVGAYMGRR